VVLNSDTAEGYDCDAHPFRTCSKNFSKFKTSSLYYSQFSERMIIFMRKDDPKVSLFVQGQCIWGLPNRFQQNKNVKRKLDRKCIQMLSATKA
jgi:hypothetical protein